MVWEWLIPARWLCSLTGRGITLPSSSSNARMTYSVQLCGLAGPSMTTEHGVARKRLKPRGAGSI